MDELIWIVAGNYHEFRQYFYKKKRSGDVKDYRYVYGVDQLRGQENLKGFYIGTYRQRKDLRDIQDQIAISKREYRFVGQGLQGLDWRGMAITNPCNEVLLPTTPSGNWFRTLYMDEYEETYSNQWTADSGSNKTT
jgi:hypothetical protein